MVRPKSAKDRATEDIRAEEVSLHSLFPSFDSGGARLAFEYVEWLRTSVSGTAGRPYKHQHLRALTSIVHCSSRDGAVFACGAAWCLCGARLHLFDPHKPEDGPIASQDDVRCPPALPVPDSAAVLRRVGQKLQAAAYVLGGQDWSLLFDRMDKVVARRGHLTLACPCPPRARSWLAAQRL